MHETTRRRFSLLLGALALPLASRAPAAEKRLADSKRMTRDQFAEYVRLFNATDERYADIYTDDVVFPHLTGTLLRGRPAIVEFYRQLHHTYEQRLIPGAVVIDNDHGLMAVELTVQLSLRPGAVARVNSGLPVLKPGEQSVYKSVVIYTLRGDRISHIRGAEQTSDCAAAAPKPPTPAPPASH